MINIGPAGSEGLGNEEGMKKAVSIGCKAFEVEFTYGVKMSNQEAKRLGEITKKLGLIVSVHGPYYINLVSKEKAKIEASKKRILDSCERGHYLTAKNIVFHAGYYQDFDKEEVYQLIKKEILEMQDEIKKKGWDVKLAPETTGKKSQFGTVDELLRLTKEIGCSFCVDFAHILARNNGNVDYEELVKKLPKKIHCHFSGIEYGDKGEKRHIPVSIPEFKKIVEALNKYEVDAVIINESPEIFKDLERMRGVL